MQSKQSPLQQQQQKKMHPPRPSSSELLEEFRIIFKIIPFCLMKINSEQAYAFALEMMLSTDSFHGTTLSMKSLYYQIC